jgi:hypothetical protein
MPTALPPIDDDVFAALQSLAEPLVDDVNSVLRRLLGLDDSRPAATNGETGAALSVVEPLRAHGEPPQSRTRRRATATSKAKRAKGSSKARAPRGSLLPEAEYELPMLRYIAEAGGRAPASEVVEAVGAALADRLTATDHESLASGEIRWKSRVQFVRLKLIREGAMTKDAPRGVWEITQLGRERVESAATA